MSNNVKVSIKHNIYSLLELLDSRSEKSNYLLDIIDVLEQVLKTVDNSRNPEALINRLIQYIRIVASTGKIVFNPEEEKLIIQLGIVGQKAGLNGLYMADFSDKSQFYNSLKGDIMPKRK